MIDSEFTETTSIALINWSIILHNSVRVIYGRYLFILISIFYQLGREDTVRGLLP